MRNLVFTILGWCPGALGLILRQKIYPFLLGSCGRKVLFGRFIRIFNPGGIHIGSTSVISDGVILDARSHAKASSIHIEDNVFIGAGTILRSRGREISIKKGSSLGSFCRINTSCPVTIEEDVLLAAYCCLGRRPALLSNPLEKRDSDMEEQKTVIGQGCWLGVRCYVAPGCYIGEGTVIGAHAVIVDSLPAYVVAVGRPAQTLYVRPQTMLKADA